jgi:hypothetical protein
MVSNLGKDMMEKQIATLKLLTVRQAASALRENGIEPFLPQLFFGGTILAAAGSRNVAVIFHSLCFVQSIIIVQSHFEAHADAMY